MVNWLERLVPEIRHFAWLVFAECVYMTAHWMEFEDAIRYEDTSND
jgi:hypothetical protein